MASMLSSKRATRGLRMTEMVGDAQEEDEQFWNDDVWKDDESDDSFSEEEIKPDEFDTDFGESEDDDDDGSSEEEAARKGDKTKRSNRYAEPPKPGVSAASKRRAVTIANDEEVSDLGGIAVVGSSSSGAGAVTKKIKKPRKEHHLDLAVFTPRAVRESTKSKTTDADKSREQAKKVQERRNSGKSFGQKQVKSIFDQKDLLIEAVATEVENNKWLIKQKTVEDERASLDKSAKAGLAAQDKITYLSRKGTYNIITFSSVECFPDILSNKKQRPKAVQKPVVCVITGKPAKYRDPQTLLPYADVDAYKELRAKYHNQCK